MNPGLERLGYGARDRVVIIHADDIGMCQATPEAAAHEFVTQLQRALAAGIDVTHVDNHQLSAFHPRLLNAYTGLATDARLPLLFLRLDAAGWQAFAQAVGLTFDWETARNLEEMVRELQAKGMPVAEK